MVNPELSERPTGTKKPTEPVLRLPAPGGDTQAYDPRIYEIYRVENQIYGRHLREYEREKKALLDVITAIQDSMNAESAAFIQKTPSHAWDFLRAPKNHMAPSDMARCYEIRTKYHKLSKGPGNRDLGT